MLSNFELHGLIWIENGQVCSRIDSPLPRGNSLYGFKQGDVWLYFGSAKSAVSSRISSYLNHQRNILLEQIDPTSARKRRGMHGLFATYLQKGPVEIWATQLGAEQVQMLGEYPIHMRLGMEHGLICLHRPPLNADTILREC